MLCRTEVVEPYICAIVLLPSSTDLPALDMDDAASSALNAGVQQISEKTGEVLTSWRQEAVTPWHINRQCADVAAALMDVGNLLSCECEIPQTPERVAPSFRGVMDEASAAYDRYFQVRRVESMGFAQFAVQVARISLALIDDLPYTQLDRAQLTQIIASMNQMFSTLGERMGNDTNHLAGGQRQFQGLARQRVSSLADSWQREEARAPDWQEQVAHYRWKAGHHFFNSCAIFGADALRRTMEAVQAAMVDRAAHHLAQAEQFLRGTTAAMWYAGNFPAAAYQRWIRPSMATAGAPTGFSGNQNADYMRLKRANRQLKTVLREIYGGELASVPAALRRALLSFHEADIEDSESHVLVAANKVGLDQSLAQKEWQSDLPDHAPRQTALDILRQMAEMKRREFQAEPKRRGAHE